jgi:hypothetical protein
MIDGEGSKPASVSSAGAIPGGTGSGMEEHAGDVVTLQRGETVRFGTPGTIITWRHHILE